MKQRFQPDNRQNSHWNLQSLHHASLPRQGRVKEKELNDEPDNEKNMAVGRAAGFDYFINSVNSQSQNQSATDKCHQKSRAKTNILVNADLGKKIIARKQIIIQN